MFLDPSVLVSASPGRGLCAGLFELILLGHELIFGRSIVRELLQALQRKVKLPARDATAIVLGDTVFGHATAFVTGDVNLLDLGQYGELCIVSPRADWELLRSEKSL